MKRSGIQVREFSTLLVEESVQLLQGARRKIATPKARFKSTNREKTGARQDENTGLKTEWLRLVVRGYFAYRAFPGTGRR